MVSDPDRDLRRLAKRYRILFKPPVSSDQWPSIHRNTFENICKLGEQSFVGYQASIDVRSSEQPWREQTKSRADWLAQRAARLYQQKRNEAGWRFSLENAVFQRFNVEVACPKCRARIWRSEIEACVKEFEDVTDGLKERRKSRKPCNCPSGNRLYDHYEIGTNPLFDDRTQELFYHDPLLRSELPKQEPDRVYGLQMTKNLEDLLSMPVANARASGNRPDVRQEIRVSPFREEIEPLLFPFLVLEAKSEKSSNGFEDIQTQTAFPIFALLKLQEDLQEKLADIGPEFGPLVWFLACRGDAWRVYGCYITTDEPKRYEIVQLWDGCILSKNCALQLLLIVDYIFDWARDIYRPSILRQLKCLGTGKAFDQVSITIDSDIFSMQRNVSTWVKAVPSAVSEPHTSNDIRNQPNIERPPRKVTLPTPNTKFGTLRSASSIESRVTGLCLTARTVKDFLEVIEDFGDKRPTQAQTARDLVNFLDNSDDILLLKGEELNGLERAWTGLGATLPGADSFYVLIEYATFINSSWNMVREITYLAVSITAFDILLNYANFDGKPKRALLSRYKRVPDNVRQCNGELFRQSIACLHSGSPSQLLAAAASCISLSLYSLPERMRADYKPPTENLGFGYVRSPRLRGFLPKFHEIESRAVKRGFSEPSFRRVSNRKDSINTLEFHDDGICHRCSRIGNHSTKEHHFPWNHESIFSARGTALVESGSPDLDEDFRYDLCLYTISTPDEQWDHASLATIVENHLERGLLFHTIGHPLPSSLSLWECFTIWNLPLSYRPPTRKQKYDIENWIKELRGQYDVVQATEEARRWISGPKVYERSHWIKLQYMLLLLDEGHTFEAANEELHLGDWKTALQKFRERRNKDIHKPQPHGYHPRHPRTALTDAKGYPWESVHLRFI